MKKVSKLNLLDFKSTIQSKLISDTFATILLLLMQFTIYIIEDLKDTIDDRVLPFLSFILIFLLVGFYNCILRKEGE